MLSGRPGNESYDTVDQSDDVNPCRKYKEVTETGEILTAIVNLAAANRELWPYDQVRKSGHGKERSYTNTMIPSADFRLPLDDPPQLRLPAGRDQQGPATRHHEGVVQRGPTSERAQGVRQKATTVLQGNL